MNMQQNNKLGRPRAFDEDKVLELATEYFWEKGYDHASLSQLLKVMGLSKSSFYQTFGSKQALFERCLALYTEQQVTWFEEQLKSKTSVEVLNQLFEISIEEIKTDGEIKGCLLINSAETCYKKYPDISLLVSKQFKSIHQLFEKIIRLGQEKGEISCVSDANGLASIYLNTLNGLSLMIKAGADETMINDVIKGFNQQLQK